MKRILLAILLLFSVWTNGISQKKDSTLFFKSALSVTHNGFSFIPSFSLGKPAAILDLSIGNKRLSFEPQFRFALEGRPWSFIFIYRYKIVNQNKFQFKLGGQIYQHLIGARKRSLLMVQRKKQSSPSDSWPVNFGQLTKSMTRLVSAFII